MKPHKVIDVIKGIPTFSVPLSASKPEVGGYYKYLSPLEYITDRQRAWFKGILLPALAKDTGDSEHYWEMRLKIAVLPDKFVAFYVSMGKQVFPVIPSITILGKKGMGKLIDGSVDHLRNEKIYGKKFLWVTYPDPELRAKK